MLENLVNKFDQNAVRFSDQKSNIEQKNYETLVQDFSPFTSILLILINQIKTNSDENISRADCLNIFELNNSKTIENIQTKNKGNENNSNLTDLIVKSEILIKNLPLQSDLTDELKVLFPGRDPLNDFDNAESLPNIMLVQTDKSTSNEPHTDILKHYTSRFNTDLQFDNNRAIVIKIQKGGETSANKVQLPDYAQSIVNFNGKISVRNLTKANEESLSQPLTNYNPFDAPKGNDSEYSQNPKNLPFSQKVINPQDKSRIFDNEYIQKGNENEIKRDVIFVQPSANQSVAKQLFETNLTNTTEHPTMPRFTTRLSELPTKLASIVNSNKEFPVRAEIQLQPRSYGMVLVTITASPRTVEVTMQVNDKDTLKALESQIPPLREKLTQLGFEQANVELQLNQSNYNEMQNNNENKSQEYQLRRNFLRSFGYLKKSEGLDFQQMFLHKMGV